MSETGKNKVKTKTKILVTEGDEAKNDTNILIVRCVAHGPRAPPCPLLG